ncbi:low molecular weight protein-tyrosine-phosphatase [Legionella impletisoli]|uniref:protein-tyrosine-phosphatase n=1 Tax=Legionella impletisoli TaxID=343510 RepID=A0A917NA69_9GAMM|nr:low molecular weight protein-tyrosine-phosphatase [Legionella impletisoli]GGI82255.1 protein-tyrosine-phosphatase [Legionella impletisoli]
MVKNILVVCTGNICRSPMAEALLKHHLKKQGADRVVSSAGIQALEGRPADSIAQELMTQKGIEISHHRARQLNAEMVHASDLILVMSRDQKKQVEQGFPNSQGKVFRLGEQEGFDVIDPYKRMRAIFEQSLAQIEYGLEHWYQVLSPKSEREAS